MTSLGLSARTEAVYRVALGSSTWTDHALQAACCAALDVGGEQVAAAVQDLLTAGLLRPAARDSGAHVRVVAPGVVLESRLARAREAVLLQQQELDRAAQLLHDLQDQHTAARDASVEHTIERLVGLDAVRSRLEQLAQGAEQEALSFMRGQQSTESMEASWPLDRSALERGVVLRSIYLHSALNDPDTTSYLRRLEERGSETRTVATLPLQMLVVDRCTAVIPIDPERSAAGALVVRSRGALVALLALFESVWLAARPLHEPRRSGGVELSDTEREILRILATGATDEVVGRQLGVSVRTVRRLTSGLMDRFQAQSRFELGLKLGRQGLGQAGLPARPTSRAGSASRSGSASGAGSGPGAGSAPGAGSN